MKDIDQKKKIAEYYKEKHLNDFVHITLKNNSYVLGKFTEITPNYDLYIKGNPGFASNIIDPLEIKVFSGKPDEFEKKNNRRGDFNNHRR